MIAAGLGLWLLAGCGGSDSTVPSTADQAAGAAKDAPRTVRQDLAKKAVQTSIVPSPMEVQDAMLRAEVEVRFDTMLLDREPLPMEGDKGRVALCTGIAMADLVFTLERSEKEVLLADLATVRSGMTAIGAGPTIDAALAQAVGQVTADAIERDALWFQVESMRETASSALSRSAGRDMATLVQAGGWLRGTHLMATAILSMSNRIDKRLAQSLAAAESDGEAPEISIIDDSVNLLRQPGVVRYFLKQLDSMASGELAEHVAGTREALETILPITEKASLTENDVLTIQRLTGQLLSDLAGASTVGAP
jgi:hypothetical protein